MTCLCICVTHFDWDSSQHNTDHVSVEGDNSNMQITSLSYALLKRWVWATWTEKWWLKYWKRFTRKLYCLGFQKLFSLNQQDITCFDASLNVLVFVGKCMFFTIYHNEHSSLSWNVKIPKRIFLAPTPNVSLYFLVLVCRLCFLQRICEGNKTHGNHVSWREELREINVFCSK